MIDRLSVRERPDGAPVMHQHWGSLLFLHWAFPPERIRPLVPDGLTLDTFDGACWVAVAPFTMWDLRPHGLPAPPVIGRSHELNVRTYVHRDGVPGVWFLSLDASNPLAVLGARIGFNLPYVQARQALDDEGAAVRFRSRRTHPGAPPATFEAEWHRGEPLPEAAPGSLDFFLTERYCLYAEDGGRIWRTRIAHRPWPLCRAHLLHLESTMLAAHGLPEPAEAPMLHAQAEPLHVEVWRPERV